MHLQSILPHLATHQSINQPSSSVHQSHTAGKPGGGRRSDPVHAHSAIKEETASPSQVGIFIVPVFWTPLPLVGRSGPNYLYIPNLNLIYIYTYLACLSVWVSVFFVWVFVCCLYPINVQTVEPIGPKFCVGPRATP